MEGDLMKKTLLLGLSIVMIFASADADDKVRRITHLVLLDNSGSMTHWFLKDQDFMDRLTQEFLRSSAVFRDGDEIIIRSFNNTFDLGEEVEFRVNDPDRIAVLTQKDNQNEADTLDPFTREELLKEFKQNFKPTGRDTDLKEALVLAFRDLEVYAGKKEGVIIWILSDNRQDLGQDDPLRAKGILPIVEFYEYLYENDDIRYSYFFPVIRDPEVAERNLVCYGMLYHQAGQMLFEGEVPEVNFRIRAAGKALAALTGGRYDDISPIQCKPRKDEPLVMDREIQFVPDQLDVQGRNLNDRIVFTGLEEGKGFSGRLYVEFTSRFKYWRIEKALLKDPTLVFESYPRQILLGPEQSTCRIEPRDITVGPEQTTTRKYQLILRRGAEDLFVPEVGVFSLKTFLPGARESLYGRLLFQVTIDVNSQMSLKYGGMEKEIENVKMLSAIRDFMYPQIGSSSKPYVKRFDYPVRFDVRFAPWRMISFFAFVVIALAGLSLLVFLALSRMEGAWATADSSGRFRLHFMKREEIKIDNHSLGHLSFVPGSGTRFMAGPLCKLTGRVRRKKLAMGENSVEVYFRDIKHKIRIFLKPKKTKKVKRKPVRRRY